jgi:hypothetical protein
MQPTAVTIRLANHADAAAIARLAELEEAPPLTGETLVAELDATIIAAVSVQDDRAVADIFRPTAATLRMLRHWRAELIGARSPQPVRRRRTWNLRRANAWA